MYNLFLAYFTSQALTTLCFAFAEAVLNGPVRHNAKQTHAKQTAKPHTNIMYRMSEKSETNVNFIYYLHYMIYISSPQHSMHFLRRFTVFVRILLNILVSTVAQQSVIQDVWH
jgi:hypothetical protein